MGLDGHDRGLKVVARTLRDAGVEVIYAGLRQSPASVASIALEEDADVVAISLHNGAHLTIAPDVLAALHAIGLSTPLIVGGIVPPVDIPTLTDAGVAAVLGPGVSGDEVVDAVRAAVAAAHAWRSGRGTGEVALFVGGLARLGDVDIGRRGTETGDGCLLLWRYLKGRSGRNGRRSPT